MFREFVNGCTALVPNGSFVPEPTTVDNAAKVFKPRLTMAYSSFRAKLYDAAKVNFQAKVDNAAEVSEQRWTMA